MQRYIQENQRRDEHENPNKWWLAFGEGIHRYYFMFVSGHFVGKYQNGLERISRITKTSGAAAAICHLLLIADRIKAGVYSHGAFEVDIFHSKV
jgi:hypothetical protein